MIRVVADTNIRASGLAGYDALESPAAYVLRSWQLGRFGFLASAPVFSKFERTLARPYFEQRQRPFGARQALSFSSNSACFMTEPSARHDEVTTLNDDLIQATAVTDASKCSMLTPQTKCVHTAMQSNLVSLPALLQYPNVQQSDGAHGTIEQETFIFIAERNPKLEEPTLHTNKSRLLYQLCIEQEWECPLCRCELPHSPSKLRLELMELDHIQPKSTGGTNANKNLQAVHLRCNREKGNDRHRHRRVQFTQPQYW